MSIIKLSATDSTNSYLKELSLEQTLDDFTVVSTELQLKGRGQMGSKWVSDKGKNLTISILKKLENFDVQNQFNLNCIVSLAIYDVLLEIKAPNLYIKWPNDILSVDKKICGILIENILKGRFIQAAIIGIGLNVNQTNFGTLEKVSSLGLLLEQKLEPHNLIEPIRSRLKFYFSISSQELREKYHKILFRKDIPSTFMNTKNEKFMGIIMGVDTEGKLIVEHKDGLQKKYGLKEIKLLY